MLSWLRLRRDRQRAGRRDPRSTQRSSGSSAWSRWACVMVLCLGEVGHRVHRLRLRARGDAVPAPGGAGPGAGRRRPGGACWARWWLVGQRRGAGLRDLRRRGGDVRHPADDDAQHRTWSRPTRRTPASPSTNERNRFARDLHDILGHSLTVITVKAELAKKLIDVDPERARAELDDLERLARDALADVRRAVEGYRELTLPGELARARTALRGGRDRGRPAELDRRGALRPARAVRLDDPRGRHQRDPAQRRDAAAPCVLQPDRVEIRDDGVGPRAARLRRHGLTGLRERAGAARRHRRHADPRPRLLAVRGAAVTERPSGCCSPTTRRWSAARCPRCSASSPTSRSSPRSASATRCVDAVREHRPDVALLDVEMPGLDGIEAAAALRAGVPRRTRADRDHLRPSRLPAPRDAGRRRPASSSRTPRRPSSPTPYDGCTPACASSTPSLATDSLVAGESPLTARETDVLRAARGRRAGRRDRQGSCSSPRAPSATTSPPPSARPAPPTAPRR